MSVNFFADKILILDADAIIHGHEGKVYNNVDYPKDTVLCTDADGNVYRYDMPKDASRDVYTWPKREDKGIPLFRNYWTYIYTGPRSTLGPYFLAIEDAPKTTIIPPIGTNEL